jgi:hypothetical protein
MAKTQKKLGSKATFKGSFDAAFEAIDAAPLSAHHPIFKKADDKEFYETQLMYAYRKMEAAQHHFASVNSMLERGKAEAMAAMKKHPKLANNVVSSTYSVVVTGGPATAYIHELSAFLAAIRSGLDFLAHAAARTIKGITAHSIHTLENMAQKGMTGPILDVVKAHSDWLKELRDYRDEVIHRLVVSAPAAGWLVSVKGKTSKTVLPIVVPRKTPGRMLDTRRSRSMEDSDVPRGLNRSESYGEVTFPDGTKKTLEHKVVFTPAASYVSIAELMEHHLSEYQKFCIATLAAIVDSGFGETK